MTAYRNLFLTTAIVSGADLVNLYQKKLADDDIRQLAYVET